MPVVASASFPEDDNGWLSVDFAAATLGSPVIQLCREAGKSKHKDCSGHFVINAGTGDHGVWILVVRSARLAAPSSLKQGCTDVEHAESFDGGLALCI